MNEFDEKFFRRKYSNARQNKFDKFGNTCNGNDISNSTLNIFRNERPGNISKSSLYSYPQKTRSKTRFGTSKFYKNESSISNDVSTLPYYIVPVLYVPHKPLYEAKRAIEPHVYKAYHCKSRNQLKPRKLSISKSFLDLTRRYDNFLSSRGKSKNNHHYSFEYYDDYFRKCIEGRKSSSEISFCTEKSYSNLPPTPKFSNDLYETFNKRNSMANDFQGNNYKFGRYSDDKPTWDSPRTTNVLIETDFNFEKNCISAQTSFETFRKRETSGTQTMIQDIQKNVLVMSKDSNLNRSFRKEPLTEGIPKWNERNLSEKLSDGQPDEMSFNIKNTPRIAVSKLTTTPNSYVSRKSSGKSLNSTTGSLR